MNITKMQDTPAAGRPEHTDEEMRSEVSYIIAEQITKKLLDNGLITPGEFDKIMAKNREKFSPAIANIMT